MILLSSPSAHQPRPPWFKVLDLSFPDFDCCTAIDVNSLWHPIMVTCDHDFYVFTDPVKHVPANQAVHIPPAEAPYT